MAHVSYGDIRFEAGCDEVVKVLVKRVCNTAAKSTVAGRARSRSPREPEQLIPSVLAPLTEAISAGPSGTLSAAGLATMSNEARAQWIETARVEAILGSCRHSHRVFAVGTVHTMPLQVSVYNGQCSMARVCDLMLQCSGAADNGNRDLLPPKLEILLAWSMLFRCAGTFSNYLGYVKTACLLCKVSVEVCSRSGP